MNNLFLTRVTAFLANFREENFIKNTNKFSIIELSPCLNGPGFFFEHTWRPFPQEFFIPSLVEISTVVLEKKNEKMKSLQRRQTDTGQILIKKAHNQPLAQVS